MPDPIHETMGIEFYCDIRDVINRIPGHRNSTTGTAATRCRVRGEGAKEGDMGLKPNTRVNKEDWPSLVIEVGALSLGRTFESNVYLQCRSAIPRD